ncbi:MAG TPA: hypothetical protein PLQ36_02910, partial [Candidatus Gracilibacteria bacterium]|nr:hypothetical protein [Candidatus Gracilibacteria bacterium]
MFKKHGSKLLIILISGVMGVLLSLQYLAISRNRDYFQDKNPWRDVRILMKFNQELKQRLLERKASLLDLVNDEKVMQEATTRMDEIKIWAGVMKSSAETINLKVEGEFKIADLIYLNQSFWAWGVESLELNGIRFSPENSGFSTAGSQILVGG